MVAAGVLALGAATAGALVATGVLGGSAARPGGHRSPAPPAREPAFSFPLTSVREATAGRGSVPAARQAGESIRSVLSRFYQDAFLNRSAWTGDVAPATWNAFAPAVRARARRDSSAFTLGKVDGSIASLRPGQATLEVKVLLDPQAHAAAAFADVTFSAAGTLDDGRPIDVQSSAHYLLRRNPGGWQVGGYVGARTEVTTPSIGPGTPAPSPQATG